MQNGGFQAAADANSAGATGGAASSTADRDGTSLLGTGGAGAVSSALQMLGLQRYAESFEEHGYDSWHELVMMGPESIEKLVATVGMASNHVDRLKGALGRNRCGRGRLAVPLALAPEALHASPPPFEPPEGPTASNGAPPTPPSGGVRGPHPAGDEEGSESGLSVCIAEDDEPIGPTGEAAAGGSGSEAAAGGSGSEAADSSERDGAPAVRGRKRDGGGNPGGGGGSDAADQAGRKAQRVDRGGTR